MEFCLLRKISPYCPTAVHLQSNNTPKGGIGGATISCSASIGRAPGVTITAIHNAGLMSLFESLPRPTTKFHHNSYERLAKDHGFDGKGKTVLIVGGAGSVGSSISKAFANAEVARVAIVSRGESAQLKVKEELSPLFPNTHFATYAASITDRARMSEVLSDLRHDIDILVLCAAAVHPVVSAMQLGDADLCEAFETNCFAPFDLVKQFLAPRGAHSGTPARPRIIINVSSASLQVSYTRRSGYAASKAAFAQLLQHVAAESDASSPELAPKIYSFHPGAFYSSVSAKKFPPDMIWDDLALPGDFAVWLAGPQSECLHGRHVWANWDVDEIMALEERLLVDRTFLTVGLCL